MSHKAAISFGGYPSASRLFFNISNFSLICSASIATILFILWYSFLKFSHFSFILSGLFHSSISFSCVFANSLSPALITLPVFFPLVPSSFVCFSSTSRSNVFSNNFFFSFANINLKLSLLLSLFSSLSSFCTFFIALSFASSSILFGTTFVASSLLAKASIFNWFASSISIFNSASFAFKADSLAASKTSRLFNSASTSANSFSTAVIWSLAA